MIKLRTTLLATFSLLTLFIFNACKKDKKEGDSKATIEATTDKSEYKFYEVCVVHYVHGIGQDSVLKARVGDRPAKIAVANDSTMALAVLPDFFILGKNLLEVEIAGKIVKVLVNVIESPPPVDTPEEIINKFTAKQNQQITDLEKIISADIELYNHSRVTKALSQAKKVISDLKVEMASLTPQEQENLANFIYTNSAQFEAVLANLNTSIAFLSGNHGMVRRSMICDEGTPVEKYKCHWEFLKNRLQEVILPATLAAIAGSTISVTGVAGLAVAAVPAALAAPSLVAIVMVSAKLIHIHFKIAYLMVFDNTEDVNEQRRSNPVVFIKNTSTPFPVSMRLRNVQTSDEGSSLSWLNLGMIAVRKYNSLCDRLKVPDLKFLFGPLTSSEIKPFSLSHIKVDNISNPNVQLVGIGGTAQSPVITFTSSSSADQSFSFDVTYDDGVNLPATMTLNGVVKEPTPLNIISATVVNNTVLPGEIGEKVHSTTIPLRILYTGERVTDIAILTNPNATPGPGDWKTVSSGTNTVSYTYQAQFSTMTLKKEWRLRIFLRSGSIVSGVHDKTVEYSTILSFTPVAETDGETKGVFITGCPPELIGTTAVRTHLYYHPTEGGRHCGTGRSFSQLSISDAGSYSIEEIQKAAYSSFKYYNASGTLMATLTPGAFAFYERACGAAGEASPYSAIRYVEVSYWE